MAGWIALQEFQSKESIASKPILQRYVIMVYAECATQNAFNALVTLWLSYDGEVGAGAPQAT